MPRTFVLLLVVLGILLTVTVIPGVFTIDEDNYLVTVFALRHGRLTVPGTDDLTPSRALAWFDPQAHSRRIDSTPVSPTAPPLYAPLALPFSFLGWRALVALNTFAFLYTAALVFLWARRYGGEAEDGHGGERAGWLAAAAFLFAGYSIEYAQGLWPHMITVSLAASAAYLASRLRNGAAPVWALVAGLAAGLAAGVRYQNVVLAVLVGAGVFLFTPLRWRASAYYAAGAALPLLASSLINRIRLGFWNPISKGPRYFSRGGEAFEGSFLEETFIMAWSRIVDYGQRPAPGGLVAAYLQPHPESGVYLVSGAVKKAWLQSSPWLALALLLIMLCWAGRTADSRPAVIREIRAVSLIVLPILLLFASFGVTRTDGLSFNQRYFLELVPLMAVVFGWGAERATRAPRMLFAGVLAGLLLAGAALIRPAEAPVRHLALSWLPLVLAAAVVGLWLLDRFRGRRRALALVVGASLGFGLLSHLGDDVMASRHMRDHNLKRLEAIEPHLPSRAAIFALWGNKDPLGPLFLDGERNLVVVDPFADRGESAALLTTELLAQGRPVLLIPPFPEPLVRQMAGDRTVTRRGPMLEIGAGELFPGTAP